MKQPAQRTISLSPSLLAAALVLITIVAYLPALGAGFIWDDPDYVLNNANLRTGQGLAKIWLEPRSLPQYYPLVHTTFWIEYQLWGLSAGGYHAINILLHALGSVLLWRVLTKLQAPGAWLAAAIFAVHPVQVESVAWITERKNVLSGVFYFAAALGYLGYEAPRHEGTEARRGMLYAMALTLFVCALLSKTVTCSLPAALLLVIWWKRGRVTWADLKPVLPMFVIGAALAFYTAYLEHHHVGAGAAVADYPPLQRLIIAGRALWIYATKIVAPIDLSFVYPKWTIQTWEVLYFGAAVLAVVALVLLRRRIGRGPAAAVLFFGGTVLPALGFVTIYPMRYTFAADHYQYLASVGLIVLIAAGIDKLPRRRSVNLYGAVLLAPLMILTFARTRVFHDPLTLWTDTVARNPGSWMVHLNLAHALARNQQPMEAEMHFRRAVELAPELPETHWNLGTHYANSGNPAEAMRNYDNAIRIDRGYAGAYYGRGNVFLAEANLEQAKTEFLEAVEHFPDYSQAHFNLGLIAERQGDQAGAIARYSKAIESDSNYAEAHNYLARLLVKDKQFDQALRHYRQAVRIRPAFAEARLNLGALLARMGQLEEARDQIAEAVRLDPSLGKFENEAMGR